MNHQYEYAENPPEQSGSLLPQAKLNKYTKTILKTRSKSYLCSLIEVDLLLCPYNQYIRRTIMYIVTDDLEIINFYQYKNLSVEGEDPGKGQLVLTAQDGSKRVIAEFAEFEEAYNLFFDIRDALAAGETYYSLETYMEDNPFRVPAQQREKHTTV